MPHTPPKWERTLMNVVAVPAGITLFAMMIYVTLSALSRTLFSAPLPASLELTQYWAMPILASLGFIAAQLADQHVSADLFFGMFSERSKKWLLFGMYAVSGAVTLAGAYFTMFEAIEATERGKHAGVTDIPSWPPHLLVPVCLAVLAILFWVAAVRAIRRNKEETA